MPDAAIDLLIERLSADARPIRPLARPWVRAGAWLGAALWVALLLSFFTNFPNLRTRLMAVPDMWLSEAGALGTAVLAALAAFESSIPGRSRAWALLPLPAFALWVGASGYGCLRMQAVPGTIAEPHMHGMVCVSFMLLVAVPLAALLMVLLLRACPLRPGLTALLGGMACAGAASVLLSMIHPFDATGEDLAMHLAAVLAIIGLSRIVGRRVL